MNVYLHEIDINENGTEISLPCSIYEYLTKFILFTDQIYLQSSSALKRRDMVHFYCSHPDYFTVQNQNDPPYISFVLDPRFNSLSEYIDDRMSILSSNSDKQNTELAIYRDNKALQIAKRIDGGIKSEEFAHRSHNVNVIYRNNLQNLNITVEGNDISKGIDIINDYVINNKFIQTFDLMAKIDNVVIREKSRQMFGKAIRTSYFQANATAVNCTYHNRDWHLLYSNINQYCAAIGLDRLFIYNWKINAKIITIIKSFSSFKNLISLYYSMSDHQRFIAFLDYATSRKDNSLYHLYEVAYFKKQRSSLKKELDSLKSFVPYHEER